MKVGMYDEATKTLQSKQSGVLIYVCTYIHILHTHATHAHTRTHTFNASADVRRGKKGSQHYQKTIHLYRGLVYIFIHIYMYIQTHTHTHTNTRAKIYTMQVLMCDEATKTVQTKLLWGLI